MVNELKASHHRSIAEALISKANTFCFDCPTRGLDASTAREYVKSLRALSNIANVSTAAALYQAGEQLFQQFDKVLVIDQGQCLYFGPVEQSVPYFEKLGFVKPSRWTSADFLISITDKKERLVKRGLQNTVPADAADFGRVFRQSELNKSNWSEIEAFEAETKVNTQNASLNWIPTNAYALPLYKQIILCAYRQLLVVIGDKRSLARI